ncbi:MAG TPA: alpha/beta hydrolase [Capillibacterium sp.]
MEKNERMKELLRETEQVVDPHRQFYKIRFEDNSMDFAFQWMLGAVRNGGGEIGELFYTAAQIEDYNPDSWAAEWPKMAERVEKRGEIAEAGKHFVSAREFYLRAAGYYRAALTALLPEKPAFKELYAKAMRCFSKAGAMFRPEIEMIRIPFEDTYLPGCYIKAEEGANQGKTIVAIGGAETFFIDLYFQLAPSARKRGYNFVTVDLPGQGVLPFTGHFFRPDTEKPIGAILDFVLSRPEVDPERIAVYGISGGGYYVPRAAVYDKRIKACITNCAVTNIGKIMAEMAIQAEKIAAGGVKMSPFNQRMFQIMAWRHGLSTENIPGLLVKTREFVFDPSSVICPALNICSNGEYLNPASRAMEEDYMEALPNPKKMMIVAPFADGGGTHCLGENTSLLSALIFDWLDEIFA